MEKLAVFGGDSVRRDPWPDWPKVNATDEKALLGVDPFLKDGPGCRELEARFAELCGGGACIPVANGTVSLEMILRALEIGFGDEVILPAYTFIATMSSVVFTGAVPVFADIEPDTYNLSAQAVEEKVSSRTRAVIAVAVGGRPCDFEQLEALCLRHGIALIVDAAQAVGARMLGQSIACFGTAASFSFQNTKNLTAGEGGMIVTRDHALAAKLREMLNPHTRGFFLDHRMGEQQAALLISQLEKLPREIDRRSRNARRLDEILQTVPFVKPMAQDARIDVNGLHLYVLRIDHKALAAHGVDRERIIQAVNAEGLPLTAGYLPLYAYDCTASPEVEKAIGRKIDRSPLPVSQRAGYLEGSWLYHSVLLAEEKEMELVGEIFWKVARHIDQLGRKTL